MSQDETSQDEMSWIRINQPIVFFKLYLRKLYKLVIFELFSLVFADLLQLALGILVCNNWRVVGRGLLVAA